MSGGSAVVDFKMSAESSELDEVVVVGYGVQRKRELTNSVISLKDSELQDMPSPSFENAIQGKASGVQVITGSGLAGSGSVIRVRGIASVSAGGDPLYIVDGIPITQDYFGTGNRGAMNSILPWVLPCLQLVPTCLIRLSTCRCLKKLG